MAVIVAGDMATQALEAAVFAEEAEVLPLLEWTSLRIDVVRRNNFFCHVKV